MQNMFFKLLFLVAPLHFAPPPQKKIHVVFNRYGETYSLHVFNKGKKDICMNDDCQ